MPAQRRTRTANGAARIAFLTGPARDLKEKCMVWGSPMGQQSASPAQRPSKRKTRAWPPHTPVDATSEKKGPHETEGEGAQQANRHGPTENDNEYRQNLYMIVLLGMIQAGIDPTACAS